MTAIERQAAEIVHNNVQVIDLSQQFTMKYPLRQRSVGNHGLKAAGLGTKGKHNAVQQDCHKTNEEGLNPNKPIVHYDDPVHKPDRLTMAFSTS